MPSSAPICAGVGAGGAREEHAPARQRPSRRAPRRRPARQAVRTPSPPRARADRGRRSCPGRRMRRRRARGDRRGPPRRRPWRRPRAWRGSARHGWRRALPPRVRPAPVRPDRGLAHGPQPGGAGTRCARRRPGHRRARPSARRRLRARSPLPVRVAPPYRARAWRADRRGRRRPARPSHSRCVPPRTRACAPTAALIACWSPAQRRARRPQPARTRGRSAVRGPRTARVPARPRPVRPVRRRTGGGTRWGRALCAGAAARAGSPLCPARSRGPRRRVRARRARSSGRPAPRVHR
ncbi:hypothetical protein H181DRAFT_03214 [Streptomyces sp. WMMB 714]|nr:hypothetical protein H181DRAFT_03214 [Streptomyces sp. WMMB 714]